MITRLFLFAFILLGFKSTNATGLPVVGPEDFVIEQVEQHLEFFLNKKKELNARLHVEMLVSSKSSLNNTFTRAVFIDNNSEVSKIVFRYDGKKKTREPIYTDYESNGIFHSDLKMCLSEFQMYKKEKLLQVNYTKTYTDLKYLDPLYFNDMYQVESSEIMIEVPEWLDLEIVTWNFDKEQPAERTETKKKAKIYHYTLENLEPSNKFAKQPRRSKINAHLICLPKSYTVKGQKKTLMQNTGDLYGWYSSLVKNVDNNTDVLQKEVDALTSGLTDDEEKIKKIFYWVQDNIRYIAFEYGLMGFQPEDCQSVYGNKYGDCKGMANLTKQMLNLAGFDARLTWIGTNDLPYTYELPSLIVDNHMICTVILDDQKIFLDATEKYSDMGTYAHRIQGKQVMIENGKDFIIEEIPVSDYKSNKEETNHEFDIVDNALLVGNGNLSFSGSRNSWFKNIMSGIPEKEWDKSVRAYIGNADKNVSLTITENPKIKSRDLDLKMSYDISIENNIVNIGSEMYINPEIDYQFKEFEIDEDRNVPYEFSNKYYVLNTTVITIPEGWKSTYLPEPVQIENEKYGFELAYTLEEGKIIYTKKIEIKDDTLLKEDFEGWNTSIKTIGSFYEDQIILSK